MYDENYKHFWLIGKDIGSYIKKEGNWGSFREEYPEVKGIWTYVLNMKNIIEVNVSVLSGA